MVERLFVICEGQTEEAFANTVLAPHFHALCGAVVRPLLIPQKGASGGRRRDKGGWVSYTKTRSYLRNVMEDHHGDRTWFTTMLDLYGIPSDFPRLRETPPAQGALARVRFLENAFKQDVVSDSLWRFTPHLQLHEFEALLLVSPKAIVAEFFERQNTIADLAVEIAGIPPEEIDEGRDSAPSKRIIRHIPEYGGRKVSAGPKIAAWIGLPRLRECCPHFAEWLTELEWRVCRLQPTGDPVKC